jgi:hypothetical protein
MRPRIRLRNKLLRAHVAIPASDPVTLTGVVWKSATSRWNQKHVGHYAGGGPLIIGEKAVGDGIGMHAKSVQVYGLPAGAKRFRGANSLADSALSIQVSSFLSPATTVRAALSSRIRRRASACCAAPT